MITIARLSDIEREVLFGKLNISGLLIKMCSVCGAELMWSDSIRIGNPGTAAVILNQKFHSTYRHASMANGQKQSIFIDGGFQQRSAIFNACLAEPDQN